MKKRHVPFLALALVLVVSLLAGCTGAAPAPAPTATTAPAAQPTEPAAAEPTEPAAAGEPSVPKPAPVDLLWASGPQGGSWLSASAAIAELFQKNVPGSVVTIEPGGGVTNLKLVEAGEAELGMTNSSSFIAAAEGRDPFEAPFQNTRTLAHLYLQYHQMVVLADAGINEVPDIVGKRFVPSAPGQTTYEVNAAVLDAHGLSYEDLEAQGTKLVLTGNQGQANDMLKDKQVDAVWWSTALPSPGFVDVALSRDVKLIGISDEVMEKLLEKYPEYNRTVIPAGTYKGQDEPVQTIGWYTTIIINKDVPDDVAYWLAKSIYEGRDDLVAAAANMSFITKETIANDMDVFPLHPGAKKYYEEIGATMK